MYLNVRRAPRWLADLRETLPTGNLLPDEAWQRRHTVIVWIVMLHVPALMVFGLLNGLAFLHVSSELLLVGVPGVVARSSRLPREIRASLATFGLVSASAILVHFSGGMIEAHFHFFVVIGLITLYQSWFPFLLAIGYVVLHHGIVGTIDPAAVYNYPDAIAHPWKWALIHGAAIAAASAAYLAAWRLTEHQSLHDTLTQLPNRALFRDRVEQVVARTNRSGMLGGVMFVDVDDFKSVNDTLGHAWGDQLIVAIARRLSLCLRKPDTVARLGGDEFGVVLEEVPTTAGLRAVAARVLRTFEEPFDLAGRRVVVSASIGVVSVESGAQVVENLIRDADIAMYCAKRLGKRRYVVFDETMTGVGPSPLEDPAATDTIEVVPLGA
jgi:diguanylate cyclase (GGDEF)-like protein